LAVFFALFENQWLVLPAAVPTSCYIKDKNKTHLSLYIQPEIHPVQLTYLFILIFLSFLL